MSVLSNLARVLRVESPPDVHAYALANAVDIAFSLGVELPAYLDMLDEQILAALPARLKDEMKNARKGETATRIAAMQRAADVMGHSFVFEGDRAALYLAPFLESIVAGPEYLAFPRWDMAVSLDVLRRFRPQAKRLEWCAFVDRDGLHLRWSRDVTGPVRYFGRADGKPPNARGGEPKRCHGGINVWAEPIPRIRRDLRQSMIVCNGPPIAAPAVDASETRVA